MASPPVEQRATGDRGTTDRGTDAGAGKAGAGARNPPKRSPAATVPVAPVAPIGSCLDFITIDPERSDTRTGIGVHRIIREQVGTYISAQGYGPPIRIRLPDASFEHYREGKTLPIGGNKGSGDVDLAFRSRSRNVMLLAEVKPANREALEGETQLENYLNKANANEDVKRRFEVSVFSPMRPIDAMLPPEVIYIGRRFQIRWCGPGIILYKEIDKKKDKQEKEKEEKKKEQQTKQSSQAQAKEQSSATGKPRSWAEQVQILGSAPRRLELPNWAPEALRREIQANTLEDGLYRDRFSAAWPSGYSTNVVVWVRTGPFGREYQFYQEFPSDPAFYQYLANRHGLSDWQRQLVRSTLVEYNNDLWSLIAPDAKTGVPSSMSPYYARDELRTIYAEILKGVVGGSARIVGAGAAITSISNAMRQRGTEGRSITRDTEPTKEEPLPDWVTQAVQKGAEAYRQSQRVVPAVP
jgi:hypothetical protein